MRVFLLLAAAWGLSGSAPIFGDERGPGTGRVLRGAGPPDPGRALRPVSRAEEAGVGPAARFARRACVKGNDAGPVVVPGRPEESPLVEAVRYDGAVKMPPAGKLPDRAIADLAAWVQMGAPWPESPIGRPSPSASGVPDAAAIAAAARRHWAFRPVRRSAAPGGPRCRLARGPARPVHPGPARGRRARTLAAGRPADLDPPRRRST